MPLLLLLLVSCLASAHADGQKIRQEAFLNRDYQGVYQAQFNAQFDRVRVLVRQAQLEVSSRLGLFNYRDGFTYPMVIQFADGAPRGVENALAYVQLLSGENPLDPTGPAAFQQQLVVNLPALVSHPMDFDTVFYHEMTHAVMNDAVGGEASLKIPHWLQEGLAIYVSGEGDTRVKTAAESTTKGYSSRLVFDLNGPVYGAAYPQYYLAVRYIMDKHSINAVQGIVRELIEGKSLDQAIQDCLGISMNQYLSQVREYSLKVFKDLAPVDSAYTRPIGTPRPIKF